MKHRLVPKLDKPSLTEQKMSFTDPFGYQNSAYISLHNQNFGRISQPIQFCPSVQSQPSAEMKKWASDITPSGNGRVAMQYLNNESRSSGFVHTNQPHFIVYPSYYAQNRPW